MPVASWFKNTFNQINALYKSHVKYCSHFPELISTIKMVSFIKRNGSERSNGPDLNNLNNTTTADLYISPLIHLISTTWIHLFLYFYLDLQNVYKMLIKKS